MAPSGMGIYSLGETFLKGTKFLCPISLGPELQHSQYESIRKMSSAEIVRAPQAVDQHASKAGLRTVATIEALKGIIVLLLGVALLGLLHKDAEDIAERFLEHLHINPDRRLAQALLNSASRVTDARLWATAAAAVIYAAVRFTESWGLWNRRVWAEWFALLSGALYLPWEVLKVAERPNWEHLGILAANLCILLYMIEIRIRACRTVIGCGNSEALR
jgi:uncharacterized membrane protein (DUF2068 family)